MRECVEIIVTRRGRILITRRGVPIAAIVHLDDYRKVIILDNGGARRR